MVAFDHQEYKNAIRIWTEAAEKGDPDSQAVLGKIYGEGAENKVTANYPKSRYYLEKCEPKLAVCALLLGRLYDKGLGVKSDPARAEALYRKVITSANDWPKGMNKARTQLGLLLVTGRLGKERYSEASEWFRLAANGGNPQAQFWTANLLSRSSSPDDLIEADKWCLLAMNGDDIVQKVTCESLHQTIEKKLTRSEIETAHQRAANWKVVIL